MKVSFYLREKPDDLGRKVLMCRYSHSAGLGYAPWRFPVTTPTHVGIVLHPDLWVNRAKDRKTLRERVQRVRKQHPNADQINAYIEALEKELYSLAYKISVKETPIPDRIKEEYKKRHTKRNVLALFAEWAKGQCAGKSIQLENLYKYTLKDLKAYSEEKPITFLNLDIEFARSFISWSIENGKTEATAAGRVARFKQFMKYAHAKGYTQNAAYMEWTGRIKRINKPALTLEELKDIQSLPLTGDELIARDVLFWLCFSGMRHSEYMRLSTDLLKGDILTYEKSKARTGERAYNTLYLNFVLRQIWETYQGPPPPMERSKLSILIKRICQAANINELVPASGGMKPKYTQVATHTGRRTLATLMDKYGAALGGVQRTLGHSSRAMTEKYIKSREGLDAQRGFDSKIREIWRKTS